MLLWTPSEAPKALQGSECSELFDPMRAILARFWSPGRVGRLLGRLRRPFRRLGRRLERLGQLLGRLGLVLGCL